MKHQEFCATIMQILPPAFPERKDVRREVEFLILDVGISSLSC